MDAEKQFHLAEEKKEQNGAHPSNGHRAFCVALPSSGEKPVKLTGNEPH